MDDEEALDATLKLYDIAAIELISKRRSILAQIINFSLTNPSRQLAERVLLLAELQTRSGRLDHARSERMVECYGELRKRLTSPPQPAGEASFAHIHHEGAQIRAFDCAVGIYLCLLMTLAAVQVADGRPYSVDWSSLLLGLHNDLGCIAAAANEDWLTDSTIHGSAPPALYTQSSPESQAQQIRIMKKSDLYQVLPSDPRSKVRFALMQLALIVIEPDGQRRDIDLAEVVREERELPHFDKSPSVTGRDKEPTIAYVDRSGVSRSIAYDREAMRYKFRSL